MRGETEQQVEIDPGLADMLVCPACHGDLRVNGARLVCGGCGRRYAVVDGIPVLIAERAETSRTT